MVLINKEKFYHNKIHTHKDCVKLSHACCSFFQASGFLVGLRLKIVPGRPFSGSYSKVTDSTSEAFRGGRRECKNCDKCDNHDRNCTFFTKKDMVTKLRKQALTSNIKRLKRNIRHHEKQRQELFLELQQLERPHGENMIKQQGNLELL